MQFTATIFAFAVSLVASVSANPIPDSGVPQQSSLPGFTSNPSAFNCKIPNVNDIPASDGTKFSRFPQIDFYGNDLEVIPGKPGWSYGNIPNIEACVDMCVQWNKDLSNPRCYGVSWVPSKGSGCWLKSQAPTCGQKQTYEVCSALLQC